MPFLKQIEKVLDQRLRGIFGAGAAPGAREAIELYRDALDQIAARASVGKRGDRVFPFDRITIELLATTPERKAVLETIFEPAQMMDDVRAALVEERVTAPHELAIDIHFVTEAAVEMRVLCENAARPSAEPAEAAPVAITPAKLTAKTGVASSSVFVAERQQVMIGREPEVVDSLGRAVRRNDLYFPETAHEANSTVSRAHAHLRFDAAGREWRIYDDGSSLGTSIFRDGRRIEVPPHSSRGVGLRPGDEIYLGQARLLFE